MLHAHAHPKIDEMNGTHSGYFVCMYVSNRCVKFTTSWPTNLGCVGTVVFVHTHLICVSLYTHTSHVRTFSSDFGKFTLIVKIPKANLCFVLVGRALAPTVGIHSCPICFLSDLFLV